LIAFLQQNIIDWTLNLNKKNQPYINSGTGLAEGMKVLTICSVYLFRKTGSGKGNVRGMMPDACFFSFHGSLHHWQYKILKTSP
jgi:hypothetical protein